MFVSRLRSRKDITRSRLVPMSPLFLDAAHADDYQGSSAAHDQVLQGGDGVGRLRRNLFD